MCGWMGIEVKKKRSSKLEGNNLRRLVYNRAAVTISRTTSSKQATAVAVAAGAGQGTIQGRSFRKRRHIADHRISEASQQSTKIVGPYDNTNTSKLRCLNACNAFPHPGGLRDPACAPPNQHFRRTADQRFSTTRRFPCMMRRNLTSS